MELFSIIRIMKKSLIFFRTSIKLLSLLTIGILLIVGIVTFVYKPTYSVALKGEQIGYTNNKSELQKKINEYIEKGEGENIGFVQIDELPTYKLCLLKKDVESNDEEIFDEVKNTGTAYYKYYAILKDNEEKYYVPSFEEAEDTVAKLNEKQGDYKQNFGFVEKYQEDIKEFTAIDEVVAKLYVEKPKPVQSSGGAGANVKGNNTSGSKIDIGIALARPTVGTITSRYGTRGSGFHTGIDIGASTGTAINAASGGTVTHASYWGGYGNIVIISHGNGVETYYAHCSRMDVSVGQTVSAGELIAAVGSTGNSSGPHLHFEVRVNGVSQNPQNYVY